MKKMILFFLLVGSSVFAQVKDTRKVEDFSKVKVSQSIKLDFTYGGSKSVVVEVENKEDLQYIKTEVSSNGQLRVFVDTPKSFKNIKISNIRVYVSNPSLDEVAVSSSAKFTLLNTVKSKSFKVAASSSSKYDGALVQTDNLVLDASSSAKISGSFEVSNTSDLSASSSSHIEVQLKTNKADLASSSSAKLSLSGNANSVNATVSSSASIKASEYKTKQLIAKASSSGFIDMEVSEELSGKASSSGKIIYRGNAKVITNAVSSGGQIKKG